MNQNIVNLFTSVINSMEFAYIIYKAFEKWLPICLSSLPSNTYTSDGWIPALLFLTPWHIRNASRKTLCTEQWNRSAWVWGLEMRLSFFWQDPWMGSTCHFGRGSQTSAVPCLVTLVTPGPLGFLLPLQFSSVAQSCPTLCDPMDCSTPGLPVHHQLPELTQTHVHWVGDAIQPSHPVIPYFSCLQSFPASGSFQMSQLFASASASASTSVLPRSTQDWSPLGWTGWISLQSSPTLQFKNINPLALSLLYGPPLASAHDYCENLSLVPFFFLYGLSSSPSRTLDLSPPLPAC